MIPNALDSRACKPIALLGACWLLITHLGCTGPPPPAAAAWTPNEGLIEVDTRGRGLLLVRPDHQLGRYDDLLIERVGFRYRRGQRWLSPREEQRISNMLTAVVQGSPDGAVGIAHRPGPCVLSVQLYLTDLEIYDPDYGDGSTTSFVRSFGEATLVLELRDSLSDLPLARFLQRRELGGGSANGNADASLRRLGTVVGVAMRDMGQQLQRLTPPTRGRWDAQCKGGMTRVALGSH